MRTGARLAARTGGIRCIPTDLRLDSVGILTLAVEVEDRFRVCLDAADEAAIRTIGDLERVLRAKLEA